MNYDHSALEQKWRKTWLDHQVYEPIGLAQGKPTQEGKPYYNLMMFPYPSAEGLHVGNMYAFTGADVYGRYMRMLGYDVLEPIGLDGFGIHSENYAIKIGKHPADQAKVSQAHFYDQLSMIGDGFAWNERLETYDPEYYKWTQWIFIEMFKRGLAYRKTARVNWCPSCKTVLADEQVEGGVCERCKTEVEQKQLAQWFFRITKYAEPLLEGITHLDWPNKIKLAQQHWIGKSEGARVKFAVVSPTHFDSASPHLRQAQVADAPQNVSTATTSLEVFTTRLDTIYGVTFMVVAPEHPILDKLVITDEAKAYRVEALKKSEQARKLAEKDKTGADTGLKAINPVTGEEIPIYVADFVLMAYGTGAIMAVPAHDERDNAFARKFGLPKKPVIVPKKLAKADCFSEDGILTNSGQYDGLTSAEARKELVAMLEKTGKGQQDIHYHLRDWLISRQRYWGPPIPMVYCDSCAKNKVGYLNQTDPSSHEASEGHSWESAGWWPVEKEQLPVALPRLEDFQPKGEGMGPLAGASDEWLYTTCPHCGGRARRETDVSDTFLDSSWYFLAYPNLHTPEWKDMKGLPWDKNVLEKWLPVNTYIGGAEHAVLHLLYSRFVWKALQDWGYIANSLGPEPFPRLFGHGLIIKDGAKMSKSRGNIVNPDEYIAQYGADTLRTYLMFLGPYDQGGDFRDSGIAGTKRFLDRVWRQFESGIGEQSSPATKHALQEMVAKMRDDLGHFRYNTAISAWMTFMNVWQDEGTLSAEDAKTVVRCFAPIAPYMAEELWNRLQGTAFSDKSNSVHRQLYPEVNEADMVTKPFLMVAQVNGKMRHTLEVPVSDFQSWQQPEIELRQRFEQEPLLAKWLDGKKIIKVVYVPPTTKRQGMLNWVVD
jgi:leucyl-tRNA synthetase